jgi:hypothetical protein
MTLFNLSYDLHKERDYTRVIEGIKRVCPNWAKPLESTWLVEYSGTALDLVNAVTPYFDGDDSILVTKVAVAGGGVIAWRNIVQRVKDWINEAVARLARAA